MGREPCSYGRRSRRIIPVQRDLPAGYTDSVAFTMELMEKTGMIVTPGTAFGNLGEGYVRIALVHPVETIEKVVRIVKESGILEA